MPLVVTAQLAAQGASPRAYLPIVARAYPTYNIQLQPFATGIANPTAIANAGDDRLFVAEKNGRIRVVLADGTLLTTPFLDLRPQVATNQHQGLLGLAFDPNYASNGRFYVNYIDLNGDTQISRFIVSANPNVANPNSEQLLLTIPQLGTDHNGGDLAFSPVDGYLYIPLGDGVSDGDPDGRAQDLTLLLGKVLRLDVSGAAVAIPADNPYVGNPSARDEIWASGLRNPWRFSFDRLSGDMFIGDVGNTRQEEIDFEPAGSPGGLNFGWRCYEGNLVFNLTGCPEPAQFTFPIATYETGANSNCSVTGGYVYRGSAIPNMWGHYIFGDFCSGRIYRSIPVDPDHWQTVELGRFSFSLTTFGENAAGELFVGDLFTGEIRKIVGQ
ncbi:MAG: PQQ-dependent sugar dehydrogenase [Anaerolineales bacterium]|nr:PQQ-dependent sugar dehydrogenase [Anaerolineales bacterium]